MSKKTTNRFSPRAWRIALLGVAAVSSAVPFLVATPAAQAKRNEGAARLEIWPATRVTFVLPLGLSSDWNADPELGRAVIPVVQPELQRALIDTQKFSLILPYRFDPILRRAVQEKQVAQSDVDTYLGAPSVQTIQPVLTKFTFDQPTMVADVKLEGLTVSGTPQAPLVQLKVSGVLYEGNTVFRRAVVTSRSFGGKTPEARLTAAAQQAFADLAEQFISTPPSFELPVPVVPTPTPNPLKAGTTPGDATPAPAGGATGTLPAPVTVPSSQAPVSAPNALKTQPGAAFVPQLPAAQPPLGIGVPDRPAGSR